MKKKIDTKETKDKKKKKKKVGIVRKFFRFLLLLILIAILAYGGWFAYKYFQHDLKNANYDPLSATALGIDPEKLKSIGRINVLILGESGVGDGYKLTDSIMLVSYNPQTQQASLLSIPRDTYVGKRDKNSATAQYLMSYKMNAMYRNGENIEETVERVSDLTGVKIDNYILVDTDAIKEIVDAIGGVTFNVPIDMDYDDPTQDLHIHLKAGEQVIKGDKTEQLLRFRHNNDYTSYPEEYGDNDIGRMHTQREFIKATLTQLVKWEHINKFLEVFNIVFDNVKTDLTMENAKYYIPYAFKFNMENIKSDVVPGATQMCNGVSIYVANKAKTQKVVEELFTDIDPALQGATMTNQIEGTNTVDNSAIETIPSTVKNSSIKIELLNGTTSETVLDEVKAKLEKEGYTVTKTGQTNATSTSVVINRTLQSKTVLEEVKDIVGISQSNSSSSNSKVDFTIIIGKDYK